MTIDEVSQQFDDLQAAVVKEEADVTAFIAAIKAQGGVATQAQLDALGAKFAGVTKMVKDFDINTTTPPAPPPPLPPV